MGYIMLNCEVSIARYGEELGRFYTDVRVDPCALPERRYQYGRAYLDSTGTMYLREQETLAWHQLILPEDRVKQPGFSRPAVETKLARGLAIESARDKLRKAEYELRKLERGF